MKRFLSCLLAGMMMFSLFGCANQENETEKETEQLVVQEGTPVYEDDVEIEIGAYAGPRVLKYRFYNGQYGGKADDPEGGWEGWLTKEAFRDYMDCGFTYAMPEYDGLYDVTTDGKTRVTAYSFEESDLYAYMEMAEKMGLPVVIGSSILTGLTKTTDYRLTEDVKNHLKEMVETLSQYKMFKGFTLRDEPDVAYAQSFKAVYDYMKKLNPDLYFFTSYLPIHHPDALKFSKNYSGDVEVAYNEYMDAYADATEVFIYDHYPLIADPTSGTTSVSEQWFANLQAAAKHGAEKAHRTGITLQASSYGPEGGEETQEHRRAIKTKADASYQVYTALAYGMKDIAWFTYWEHWMSSNSEEHYTAMVDYPEKPGEEPIKTDAYYAVKEINHEIQKFDHVFLKFNWEGTTAIAKKDTEMSLPLTYIDDYKSPRIKDVKASEEAIIGCMKDEKGYDGFMIVNATDPALDKTSSVTVNFNKATKALAYIEGTETTIDLKDGTYTFELKAGEGVFVIPIV